MKKIVSSLFLAATFILCSCTENKYKVSQVSCESITIDSVIGKNSNSELAEMIKTYKIQLDKEMNLVIGVSDQYMENGKPQSLLANLTADILLKAGAEYLKEPVDLAIMNNGGLRAPLKKGDITVGDIFRIFPFENAVSILYLKGEDIKGLFDTLAKQGGEGVAGCSVTFKDKKGNKLLVGGDRKSVV